MEKPKPIPPPPEPGPASPQDLARIRADLRRNDPNAQVGEVEAVYNKLVAITGLPVQDFRSGEAMTIVDSEQHLIANAVVDNVSGQYVVARYEVVKREPRSGDVAVRLSEHRPPPSMQSETGGAGANDTNAAPQPANPPVESKPIESPANNPPADNTNAAPQKSQPAPANNNSENVPSPAAGPAPDEKKPPTEPAPKTESPAHSPGELNK
jgi:hypothetical protein